jgi:hypothetical protein
MGILAIREAKRKGAKMVIGLAGASGSGKTHTAILLAYGLAGMDSRKVGLLDTENKRGSLYSDIIKNENGEVQRFLVGDLIPPFSPSRFKEAIAEFEKTGIEVLIIDSVTHEWEGTGGCIEIADSHTKTVVGWNTAKREHKKFMNYMLQCNMHVIVCIRAREQMSFKNPNEPVSLGILPVQEKNFMFEMTASLLLSDEGMTQKTLKCPSDLKHILGKGSGYLTHQTGLALRSWVGDMSDFDRKVSAYKSRLINTTERGTEYLKSCLAKVPPEIMNELSDNFKEQLFSSAKEFDAVPNVEPEVPGIKNRLDKINPLHDTPEYKEFKLLSAGKHVQEPTTVEQCKLAIEMLKR